MANIGSKRRWTIQDNVYEGMDKEKGGKRKEEEEKEGMDEGSHMR